MVRKTNEFKVGDTVMRNEPPYMKGTIRQIFGGDGNLLISIKGYQVILSKPEYWYIVKEKENVN